MVTDFDTFWCHRRTSGWKETTIPAVAKSLPRSAGHRGRRQDPDSGDYGAGDFAPLDASGFCAPIMIARSFFVQGGATIAIEPDALEAARLASGGRGGTGRRAAGV